MALMQVDPMVGAMAEQWEIQTAAVQVQLTVDMMVEDLVAWKVLTVVALKVAQKVYGKAFLKVAWTVVSKVDSTVF